MHRASRMIVNWPRNNGKRKLPNSWHLTKAKLCLKSGSYLADACLLPLLPFDVVLLQLGK